MPYKDKEEAKEATKERVRRYRDKQKGVTEQGVTRQGVTSDIEQVPVSYIEGLSGRKYEFLPERPRYLTLSDGQVLDRLNQPEPKPVSGVMIQSMRHSNEAFNYHPNTGVLSTELRSRLK